MRPVDVELLCELPFSGESVSDGQATEEDFLAEGIDESIGDGGLVGGLEAERRHHLIEWFNQ